MTTIFWFRRDLRLHDNSGLYHALKENKSVKCIFIFDKNILDDLASKEDARVHFIHTSLKHINKQLKALGATLHVYYDTPLSVFTQLLSEENIDAVYTNHDYEPYAKERDNKISLLCNKEKVSFHSYKDQVIFEKDEVVKDDGTPYAVFTPYSKKWKAKLNDFYLKSYPCEKYYTNLKKESFKEILALEDIGFKKSNIDFPSSDAPTEIIKTYHETRNIPHNENGTTHISVHLRFGTISIRELARRAKELNETYLNELIWRDFYMMILWHHPHVVTKSYREKYDRIKWRNNKSEFKAWCEGKTGFPIVDAGMRQLNTTGYMHNRVRMIVSSFLVKDLLIDWRWGEAYFAKKLLDFDLSANNGGWQWAAGSGCDAAPYFRIFNPDSQLKKFDPNLKYVRKWIKEFDDPFSYPKPIINRKETRERALNTYKAALKN